MSIQTSELRSLQTRQNTNDAGTIVGFTAVKLHPEDHMGEISMIAVDPEGRLLCFKASLVSWKTAAASLNGRPLYSGETVRVVRYSNGWYQSPDGDGSRRLMLSSSFS